MSDRIDTTYEFTALTATTTSSAISMDGKRNLVCSLECTAHSSGAANETLDVVIQHTNVDTSLHATAAYWKNLITFTQLVNGTAVPYYEIKTLVDNGALKAAGLYLRISLTVGGTTPSFTGKCRIGHERAVVE